jgi:hypothetical protein
MNKLTLILSGGNELRFSGNEADLIYSEINKSGAHGSGWAMLFGRTSYIIPLANIALVKYEKEASE